MVLHRIGSHVAWVLTVVATPCYSRSCNDHSPFNRESRIFTLGRVPSPNRRFKTPTLRRLSGAIELSQEDCDGCRDFTVNRLVARAPLRDNGSSQPMVGIEIVSTDLVARDLAPPAIILVHRPIRGISTRFVMNDFQEILIPVGGNTILRYWMRYMVARISSHCINRDFHLCNQRVTRRLATLRLQDVVGNPCL